MRSASSRDGALRKRERGNCGRSRDGALSFRVARTKLMRVRWTVYTLFVDTSVAATQSLVDSSWRWNKINASSRDGTLFVATCVYANAMQRNALCSVNLQTFRGTGASVARVRWGVLRMRTTDSERGPSWYHHGAI